MSDALRISIEELRRRMDAGQDFTLIDSRNPHAWVESHEKLPAAIRVPADALDQHLSEIPKDKPIVIYCT